MSAIAVHGAPSRAPTEVLLAAAERAIDRARRLQTVTAALVAATTPDEVALVLAREGHDALEASAGLVWLVDHGRRGLVLEKGGVSGEVPDREVVLDRYGSVRFDDDLPVTQAAREGRPVWLEGKADALRRFPALEPAIASYPEYAAAAVPLIGSCGCLGVAKFRFTVAHRFDQDERAFLETLCRLAAQALERARLHDALQRSEERYRLASRALREVVWEYAPEVGFKLWSDGPVFGYGRVDDPDPHAWWLERLHPADTMVAVSLQRFLEGTEDTWQATYRFRRADGSYAHVVDRAVALRVDGTIRRVVGAMLDASDSHAADARLRDLLNGLPGTIVWERDMATLQVTFLSESVRDVLGYDPRRWREDDALWLYLVHPDDRERVIGTIRAHVGAAVDLEVEYRMLTADRRWAWLRERVRCVRDAGGRVVRLRGFMVEVTALKAAEEQRAHAQRCAALLAEASRTLARSLDRRETLGSMAHLAVPEIADWCGVYLTEDDGPLRLSAAAHDAPDAATLARLWRVDRALRSDPMRGVRRVVSTGWTERGVSQAGEGQEISYLVVPLTARGRILGAMTLLLHGGHYDGQDTVFAEELAARAALALDNAELYGALAAERSRLEALVQASPVGIVLLDADGTVRLWNPAAERIFGWTAQEVVGAPFPAIPEANRPDLDAALRRALAGDPVLDLQTLGRARSGAVFEVSVWAAAVPGPCGRPQCLVVVADVSRTKQLERELRARADELAERDRRKDEFLSMLGYELRNPLAPLLGAVELLARQGDDGAVAAEVRPVIERQARHMARLVDDLLDVARITRGAISLRPEPLDVRGALERALESVGPLVRERAHQVRLDAPTSPCLVLADPVRLEQVLVNLLTNAARYMPPGGLIEVTAEARPDEVALVVRDHGPGIPSDLLPRIFEAFTQGPRDLHRHEGGLGLGLTVVRRLVELHGGRVDVRNVAPRAGSEFVVTLPRCDGAPEPPAAAPAPEAPTAPEAATAPAPAGPDPRRGRRILLVDDNEDAAAILAAVLLDAGHEVRMAHDGHAALEEIERDPPEVVLLDLGLPGLDGFAVAERIRRRPPPPPLLVALTGYGDATHRRRTREAGFDDHLTKPVDFEALERLLSG